MNKLLCICPSRGRPQKAKQMVESFYRTSRLSHLILILDKDDETKEVYKTLIGDKCEICVNEDLLNYTEIINYFFKFYRSHEFYSVTNDDFFYHTESWDVKLIEEIKLSGKHGIAYGNDLLQGANLPTTSIVSREICDALGWLQMPKLHHLFGDNVWSAIGQKARCLHYRQDVIIEHRHYFSKKVPADNTFLKTNSQEMYKKDESAFLDWLINDSHSDIEKVRKIL